VTVLEAHTPKPPNMDTPEANRRVINISRVESRLPIPRGVHPGREPVEERLVSAHPSTKTSAPKIPHLVFIPRTGSGHTHKSDSIPVPPPGPNHPAGGSTGGGGKDKWHPIPPNARWTKISRRLVNPEALKTGNEVFEARDDFVVVMRVLTKDEVQGYAEVTQRIRGLCSLSSLI